MSSKIKVDPIYVQRLADALKAEFPDVYPFPDQELLLERMLWAILFSPDVQHYQELGIRGKAFSRSEKTFYGIGRDRRNQKAMTEAKARGETHYQGLKMYGTKDQPHVMRFDTGRIKEVLLDIQMITDENPDKLKEIIGMQPLATVSQFASKKFLEVGRNTMQETNQQETGTQQVPDAVLANAEIIETSNAAPTNPTDALVSLIIEERHAASAYAEHAHYKGIRAVDDLAGKTDDLGFYHPTATELHDMGEVKVGGGQYAVLHKKLKVIFSRIHQNVKDLKDTTFAVKQGKAGRLVLVNENPLLWEEFCIYCFGVGATRVSQLLNLFADKAEKEAGKKPAKRTRTGGGKPKRTAAEVKTAAAAVVAVQSPEVKDIIQKSFPNPPEITVDAALGTVSETLPEKAKETAADVGVVPEAAALFVMSDDVPVRPAWLYFGQFAHEPETLATELADMLIHLCDRDGQVISRILELANKDAQKILIDKARVAK